MVQIRHVVLATSAIAALALVAPHSAFAVDRSECTALVSIDDDLFGVRASDPVIRFTSDHASRESATIAPDASFVVYNTVGPDQRSHAHAAFASGGVIDLRVPDRPDTRNFLDRMVAERPDAIMVRYSGHNFGRFEWLSSRGDLLDAPLVIGTGCALSRSGRVACVADNVVTLEDGLDAIFGVDAFEKIPVSDEFTLAPGSSHAIRGFDNVVLRGRSLDAEGLTLDLEYGPADAGATFHLAFNDVYVFPILLAEEGAIWLHASRPHDGRVTIQVKYREGNNVELDPAIAIDEQASRIAIVRHTEGHREVITLKPTRGKAWRRESSVRIDGEPIIRRAYFVDTTTLYLAGDHAFGLVDLRHGRFEPLPHSVDVDSPSGRIAASVLDWACNAQ